MPDQSLSTFLWSRTPLKKLSALRTPEQVLFGKRHCTNGLVSSFKARISKGPLTDGSIAFFKYRTDQVSLMN